MAALIGNGAPLVAFWLFVAMAALALDPSLSPRRTVTTKTPRANNDWARTL